VTRHENGKEKQQHQCHKHSAGSENRRIWTL